MEATAFDALLRERYSCRAFRSERIPDEVLRRIFDTAQRTASWCNAQPWRVDLVSGRAVTRLSEALLAAVESAAVGPSDLAPPASYEGAFLARRRAAGLALYGSLGIGRADRDRRHQQMLENFRFFGAPHVAIVSSAAALGAYGYVD